MIQRLLTNSLVPRETKARMKQANPPNFAVSGQLS